MFLKENDITEYMDEPLEGVVDDYYIVEDQYLIDLVVRSVARGRRQEEFIRRAFLNGGVSTALYLKNWFMPWTVSMQHLIRRLLHFLGAHTDLGLVLIKVPGHRGEWRADRYYIRKIPLDEEEEEFFEE